MTYCVGLCLEDGLACLPILQGNLHVTVEPARSQQGRIQKFRTIRRSNHEHAVGRFDAIHFCQDLIDDRVGV